MKKVKKLTISEYELPIVIQKEKKGGYVANTPKWSDCYAQGETIEDVLAEISTVAASLIELYQEEGKKIPLRLKKTGQEPENNISITFPVIVSTN